MNRRITESEADLLRFVDNEATSIVQALRTMAERNEKDAAALSDWDDPNRNVRLLLRDSAKSWQAKADEFDRLFDAIPMQED